MGSDWRQYANLGTMVLAKNASIVSGEKTCDGTKERRRKQERTREERGVQVEGKKGKENEKREVFNFHEVSP